ncbi:NAD-dependent epimerase/dehydratase family protein [Kiloniella antarctica]|uniref:NAD-dependent epimerase/dehydratase family protein n=1 Tax=Kiloniella antarctica TaxID=1550907 RepID=A0ABW5BMW4_9PROT
MNFPDPKILVTGANGFIGRHVVQELATQTPPLLQIIHSGQAHTALPSITMELLDITDLPDLPTTIETIYHLAGQIWGDETHEAKMLDNVIALAKQCNAKRIVYASTCAVYGQNAMDQTVDESVDGAPASPYARGKLLGEQSLKTLSDTSEMNVTILRYFNPYGPHQFAKMAVPNMIEKAITGQDIEIYGDGEQIRDFIYIEDLAKATIAAAEGEGKYQIFNIGSGQGETIKDLASEIIAQSQSSSKIIHLPIPAERQNLEVYYRVADIGKITRLTNWEPETSLSKGLKRLVSEHRACVE